MLLYLYPVAGAKVIVAFPFLTIYCCAGDTVPNDVSFDVADTKNVFPVKFTVHAVPDCTFLTVKTLADVITPPQLLLKYP